MKTIKYILSLIVFEERLTTAFLVKYAYFMKNLQVSDILKETEGSTFLLFII